MRTLGDWLEYISSQHWQTIDMGLDRMVTMVERMQLKRPAPQVITVAGTNGKGSTCVACEGLLLASGRSVGTTLSPHVNRFNERIRLNGAEVDDATLCDAFTEIEARRGELSLTYFEFSALAALWIFQRAHVDVAILEIGLGGRLDAFNVIDADVGVITSIGLDHQVFLGDNLEAIGAEKAGILRPGQNVVLGPDLPASIVQKCTALNLSPEVLGEVWSVVPESDGQTWQVHKSGLPLLMDIPFGQCAPQNLLLAYLAAQALGPIPVDTLRHVASTFSMPGRMQRINFAGRTWLLDVAHNPAGAQFLVDQLRQRQIQPRCIVCAMLADKDHAGVYAVVKSALSLPWFLLDTQGERGLSATALAQQLPAGEAIKVSHWHEVLDEVNSATEPGDVILVLGSFNVVEQFNQRLCT